MTIITTIMMIMIIMIMIIMIMIIMIIIMIIIIIDGRNNNPSEYYITTHRLMIISNKNNDNHNWLPLANTGNNIITHTVTTNPIHIVTIAITTVSFHNFKSQNFKLSVSNPKSKYVAYLFVLSRILNCQGLGRKNKHKILKTGRSSLDLSFPLSLYIILPIRTVTITTNTTYERALNS